MKLFVAIIGVVGLSWLYDGLTRTEAQQFLRQMLFYFWPLIINNTKRIELRLRPSDIILSCRTTPSNLACHDVYTDAAYTTHDLILLITFVKNAGLPAHK